MSEHEGAEVRKGYEDLLIKACAEAQRTGDGNVQAVANRVVLTMASGKLGDISSDDLQAVFKNNGWFFHRTQIP